MDTEFKSKGYAVIKQMLSSDRVHELLTEIHNIFKNKFDADRFKYQKISDGKIVAEDLFRYYTENREGYIGCMRAIQKIPKFYSLCSSQEILNVLKRLGLKFPIISQEPIVMLDNKKTSRKISDWKTPAHQDWRSRQGSLNSISIWFGLVDITPEIGPVEIIPASHYRGLLPVEEDEWFMHIKDEYLEEDDFVSMPVKAGDAIIFSELLVHRSGINKSNKFRYSLQFRYDDLLEPNFMKRNFPNIRGSAPNRELITPNFPTPNDVKNFYGSKT